MPRRCVSLCPALLTAVLAFPALAQEAFDPRELAELLSAGEHASAYQLAQEHRREYEGDPGFDLHYGIAALELGHLGEAVFALERVVMQRPSLLRARLELARAHYRREDYQAATEHLDFILEREPSASIRASAERYRRAIRGRSESPPTAVSGYLEIGAGYDSNVASAAEGGTVDSLYGSLEFEGHGGADIFGRLGANVDIRRQLTPRADLLMQSALEVRPLAQRSAYRTHHIDHRFGIESHGGRTRTRVLAQWHWSYLDGDLQQKRLGVRAEHAYSLSPETLVAAGTRIERLRNPQDAARDSTVAVVSGSIKQTWRSGVRPTTWASVFTGEEWPRQSGQSAAAVADRQIWGASAAIQATLSPEWRTSGGLYYRHSRYGRSPELFGRKRDEHFFAAHLRLERQVVDWRIGPQLQHTLNDANLEPYGYRRTIVEMRARYRFH